MQIHMLITFQTTKSHQNLIQVITGGKARTFTSSTFSCLGIEIWRLNIKWIIPSTPHFHSDPDFWYWLKGIEWWLDLGVETSLDDCSVNLPIWVPSGLSAFSVERKILLVREMEKLSDLAWKRTVDLRISFHEFHYFRKHIMKGNIFRN